MAEEEFDRERMLDVLKNSPAPTGTPGVDDSDIENANIDADADTESTPPEDEVAILEDEVAASDSSEDEDRGPTPEDLTSDTEIDDSKQESISKISEKLSKIKSELEIAEIEKEEAEEEESESSWEFIEANNQEATELNDNKSFTMFDEDGNEVEQKPPPSRYMTRITKTDRVRSLLLSGWSKDEIERETGYKRTLIDSVCSQLSKEKGRPLGLPRNIIVPENPENVEMVQATKREPPKIFAKGSPPEAIIQGIHLPEGYPGLQNFELGLKTGMDLIVLAVKIAQELAAIGTAQAKPLISLASEMRAGEKAAAESAAQNAANESVIRMAELLGPDMRAIHERLGELEPPGEPKPLTKTIDPHIQKLMSKVFDRMTTQLIDKISPGYAASVAGQPPEGWTFE